MIIVLFFNPSRRRSSLEEIAPAFFVRDRERSMIVRNLRFVLRDTVSSSAFRIVTTAAKGFPLFTTITGSFLAFWASFDNGSDAFFSSILVIGRLFLHRFELDFFPLFLSTAVAVLPAIPPHNLRAPNAVLGHGRSFPLSHDPTRRRFLGPVLCRWF